MWAKGGPVSVYVDVLDCPNHMYCGQTAVRPSSAVLCLPESSRCLPPLLLTSSSFHTPRPERVVRRGLLKPGQVLQIPSSSRAAPQTANRATLRTRAGHLTLSLINCYSSRSSSRFLHTLGVRYEARSAVIFLLTCCPGSTHNYFYIHKNVMGPQIT